MRVVLICRGYPTQRAGGMPFVTQDRAEELARQGYEVHVLTTGNRNAQELNGVRIHQVGGLPLNWSKDFAEGCKKFCQENKPDILHTDSFAGNQMWWHGRYQMNVTLHNFSWGAFFTRWNASYANEFYNADFREKRTAREGKFLQHFASVITISRAEFFYATFYHLKNLHLVYNPIAPYFFDYRNSVKQGDHWISAEVVQTKNRNLSMFPSTSRIQIIRGKARTDMPEILDRSVGLVLPTSNAGGFDLTVAESLARFRPVLVWQTGSYALEDFPGIFQYPYGTSPLDMIDRFNTMWRKGDLVGKSMRKMEGYEIFMPENHVKNWLEVVCTTN